MTYGKDNAGAPLFAAVGGAGTILVSGDGTNWGAKTSGTTNALYGVAFGDVSGVPTFVAVGLHINADGTSSGSFVSSTDGGATWILNSIYPPNNIFQCVTSGGTGGLLGGVTCGRNQSGPLFVAVSSLADVLTSADGTNWTTQATSQGDMRAVTYGQSRFVAVGSEAAEVSSDGINWTAGTGVSGSVLAGVAYGNGVFVAVGSGGGGSIYTSPDGTNWMANTSVSSSGALNGITFGRGTFVAVGPLQPTSGETAALLTSTDGTNWVARNGGAWGTLVGVTYANGEVSQFVAVGAPDLILGATCSVTTPFSYSPLTGAQFSIFDLPFGRIIKVQFSSDLLNWTTLTNFILGRNKPGFTFSDPSATNYAQGFYSIGLR